MIGLEDLASLLVDLNCPYVHKSQSIANIVTWIKGLPESEERVKFLEWALNTVGGPFSSPEVGLVALGILSKQDEAKAVVEGKLKGPRCEEIWNVIFSLFQTHSKFDRSRCDLLEDLKRCDDFTDSIAEQVSLRDQLYKPVSILDYQMEREISKLNTSTHPSRTILNSLSRKVEEEKENLEKSINSQERGESSIHPGSSEIACVGAGLESFSVGYRKLTACAEEFESKYNSELKPTLKGKSAYTPVNTKEVTTMADKSHELKAFLGGSETTVKHINSIVNLGNQDLSHNFSTIAPAHL